MPFIPKVHFYRDIITVRINKRTWSEKGVLH